VLQNCSDDELLYFGLMLDAYLSRVGESSANVICASLLTTSENCLSRIHSFGPIALYRRFLSHILQADSSALTPSLRDARRSAVLLLFAAAAALMQQ